MPTNSSETSRTDESRAIAEQTEATLARIDASLDTASRARVLMLTHRVPWPLDRGDRIRAYHILDRLSQQCNVALACVTEEPLSAEQRHKIASLADPIAVMPIEPLVSKARAAAALAMGKAATPAYFYRRDLARTIRRWHMDNPFDAVFTYCTGMIGYARSIFTGWDPIRPRHIIDLVDVDSTKWDRFALDARGPMRAVYAAEARRLRRIEAGERDHFDAVAVVSDAEAELYRRTVGDHPGLIALRHAVDTEYFRPQPEPDGDSERIVFVGNLGYRPNVEGVTWFVKEVWPAVRERRPKAELAIVGRQPAPQVEALSSVAGVDVVGPVDDVRESFAAARVAIAPLRMGCGVQTKVLEAMAAGRAVVCSPDAARGINATDGEHLLIAETPEQWVNQIARLLETGLERIRIAAAARQRVEREYHWESCLAPLEELITGRRRPEAEAEAEPEQTQEKIAA